MRLSLRIMKRTLVAAVFVAGLPLAATPTAAGDFGLGVILGEPTGISITPA